MTKLVITGFILTALLTHCGKEVPVPPAPPPAKVVDFKLVGKTVTIEGKIKAGTSVTVNDVSLHLATAIDLLEN